MTKVSKVYFGLSRVSSDRRRAASAPSSSRRTPALADSVHKAMSRPVDESTCRHGDSFGAGRAVGHQGGVDRHAEPDVAAEDRGQPLLDLGAQPALELAAGELVDDLDDRLVAVQGHRGAGLQPGPLVGLQLPDHRPPRLLEVGLGARSLASLVHLLVSTRSPPPFVAALVIASSRSRARTPHPSPQPVKECDEPWLPMARRPAEDRSRGRLCRSARSSRPECRDTLATLGQRTRGGMGDGGESRRPEPNSAERQRQDVIHRSGAVRGTASSSPRGTVGRWEVRGTRAV